MSSIVPRETLPALLPTSREALEQLFRIQPDLMAMEDLRIKTDHVIHAGIYVRTVTMPPEAWLIGALISKATVVIVVGTAKVFLNGSWSDLRGYNVLPASAGRKQLFVSVGPTIITMLFPTSAKTVEEAEREFTEEADLLMSRRQDDMNTVVITGE